MKKVTILRGVPGCGKSTWARKNRTHVPVCSADDYFHGDGENPHEYRFNPAQLGEAHAACLKRFVSLTNTGTDLVVDNTNTTAVEMAPYVALAQACGYEVEIIHLHCSVETAAARNVHGVPQKSCRSMQDRIQGQSLPKHWPTEQVIVTDLISETMAYSKVLMQGEYVLFYAPLGNQVEWTLRKGPQGPVVDLGVGTSLDTVLAYCTDVLRIVRKAED